MSSKDKRGFTTFSPEYPGTEEGCYNYYSTEYIIWANEAAKTLTGGEFRGEGPDISACYLIPLVFEQMNVKGSAYIQYLNDLRAQLPIINSNGYFVENGKLSTELSTSGNERYKDMKCVQYYYRRMNRDRIDEKSAD